MKKPNAPTATIDGFDVVCTIGHVTFGDGDRSAYAAAFDLIAAHGADGTFTFPNEYGHTITVDVCTDVPRDEAIDAWSS